MQEASRTIEPRKGMFSQWVDVVIRPTERGLVWRDGQLTEWLSPGRQRVRAWSGTLSVEVLDIERGWTQATPELLDILPEDVAEVLVVKTDQIAVITRDGEPTEYLEPGRYVLWQLRAEVRAWLFETASLRAELPDSFARLIPSEYLCTVILKDHERGLVRRDGRLEGWLLPGRHHLWACDRHLDVEYVNLEQGPMPSTPELQKIIPTHHTTTLEVEHEHLAIVLRDGHPTWCLKPGSYILWQQRGRCEARVFPTSDVKTRIPEDFWDLVPHELMKITTIHPYERGLLYVDGEFRASLEAGRYGLHPIHHQVEVHTVDMREQEFQVAGQEVMTSDKVTIRVNLIAKYRIDDALRSFESQTDLASSLYSEVQMAARRSIGKTSLEQLLESRQEVRDEMIAELRERARSWGVELLQVDLKDVVLPGEMKTLLNRVIEAEKQAAAQNIMRREETAATRSQANTAKMIENNPTLMRLRELEALKEIAGQVQNLTIVAGADELTGKLRLGS